MLEKRKVLDKIEVQSDGVIFMKELNQILDDGKIVSSIPHRTVYTPSMNINKLPEEIKPYAQIKWTEDVVSAFKAKLESINI